MAMAALMEEPVLAAVLGARKHSPKTDDRVRFIAELVEFSTSPNFHLPIVFSLYFLAFFPLALLPLSSIAVLLKLEFVLRLTLNF